ncbi:DUF2332 domain-containing protein [Marivita sp. S2033]|uniref:DUF2332 domain-containing protein n=1 Tax=Marivita sp. S2033 TaxID=3373187 RepID=UPI0039829569
MTLNAVLEEQAGHCAALGSPFMARMLPLLGQVWRTASQLDRAIARFDGDIGPNGHSLPLRLASGLHALVLTGQQPGLVSAYPPNTVSDARLKDVLTDALVTHEAFLIDWIASPPQTNEVRRSAVLIAGAHDLVRRTGVSRLHLSELGASAGLNLMFDRFALDAGGVRVGPDDAALTLAPDWFGAPLVAARFSVSERRGVDLNPLDPRDPANALRLRAYLWPDQPHRLALTDAAIAANAAHVERGDAVDWLETRLESPSQDHMHLIYHTIAWQYFPPDKQARGTALIEAAGADATPERPLAWLALESDGTTPGAAITARLWPGDHRISLGRADFHGRWVDWNPDQP